MAVGQLGEQIEIADHQRVFGDDADRLAAFGRNLNAAAGDAKLALGRLVAIGDAGKGDHFGLPVGPGEPMAKQLGRAEFHEHLGFEIEARPKAKKLVTPGGRSNNCSRGHSHDTD